MMEKLQEAIKLSNDLELDLRQHVDFYFEVVRAHAHAQSDSAAAKFDLDQTEAELSERIRTVAAKAGEKLTVDGCAARVRVAEEFVAAKRRVLDAEREQGEWLALKLAYEARGHCLRDLTLLATRGANPSGISDYSAARERAAQTRRTRAKLPE